MPNIPAGFGQVTISFSGPSMPNRAVITCGVTEPSGGFVGEHADSIRSYFATAHAAMMAHGCFLDDLELKAGPTATGATWIASGHTDGTIGSETVPPNAALLVRKRTAAGGRKNRGRMFWPGLSETVVLSSGGIDPPHIPVCSGALATLYSDLLTLDAQPVVLHTGPEAPTPITVFDPDGRVATQRNRLRR